MTSACIRLLRAAVTALLAVGALAGCASFKSHKRIDVGPFSENTLAMIGELQRFNRPVTWTHLMKYSTLPSVIEAQHAVIPIRTMLRGVGFYSSQVVSLYQSPLPESRRIADLADYMEEYIRPGLAKADLQDIHVDQSDLDSVILHVRSSTTLLGALGAAQPLVNATLGYGDLMFERLDSLVHFAAADVGSRIEAQYQPLKTRIEDLDRMHVASIRSYTLLQRYRSGDRAALDSLRQTDPGLAELMPPGPRLTPKELDTAEHYVVQRSTTIKALRDQLEPEFLAYRSSQAELEDLLNQTDERARLGRITLTVWCRSHRNLAAGIEVPAMIDVMGIVKNTVKAGEKKVLE